MRQRTFHAALPISAIALTLAFAPVVSAPASATETAKPEEPLQIVVSLKEQKLEVFRGEEVVATSRVSSGKPGHSTPTGIFSILHKKKYHRSNIYSGAPMPWMQRLTWTGIALHESNSVPSYPASHGCVRLPAAFARELYSETTVGEHVVITGEPVAPKAISNATLPQPEGPRQYDPTFDQWRVLVENAGVKLNRNFASKISTAALLYPVRDKIGFERKASGAPLRILITRRSRQDITGSVQYLLNKLGYDAGPVDGLAGRATAAAVKAFQDDHNMSETGIITPHFTKVLYKASGAEEPETGHIFVRSEFEPVFDAPIYIDHPDQPLGTHLITATKFDTDAMKTEWLAMTLENQLPEFTRAYFNIAEDAPNDTAVNEALERISIPEDVRQRIARMLTPGSSIAISDTGLSGYTGWKTDFVVVTRIGRPA